MFVSVYLIHMRLPDLVSVLGAPPSMSSIASLQQSIHYTKTHVLTIYILLKIAWTTQVILSPQPSGYNFCPLPLSLQSRLPFRDQQSTQNLLVVGPYLP